MLSKIDIGLPVKYPLFLSDCNETWIFPLDFEKYSSIKFHENPWNGGRVVPWGQTERQTDITNLANTPKICRFPHFVKKIFPYISINIMPCRYVGWGEVNVQLHAPVAETRRKCRLTGWIEVWLGLRPGVDNWVKRKKWDVCNIKVCQGSRGIPQIILNFGTRWKWVINFTPWPS